MKKQKVSLEKDFFKDLMIESSILIKKTKSSQCDFMNEDSLREYELWAPYILCDFPTELVNSPGFKIAFLQIMSIVLVQKKDNEKKLHVNCENIIDLQEYKNSKNLK